MKSFLLLAAVVFLLRFYCASAKIKDTSAVRVTRFDHVQKRSLIWPSGSINWSQMVIGIGLPVIGLNDDMSVTFGLAFKSLYWLPTNASDWTNPNDIFYANETVRSLHSRWSLYKHFGYFAESFGFGDGKSCILRAICDVANVPFHGSTGLMEQLMHVFFTPSSTRETVSDPFDHDYHVAERMGKEGNSNCAALYPGCNNRFMDLFTRILAPQTDTS